MLHLFNIFRENDGNENCAQVFKEEVCVVDIKLFSGAVAGEAR